jgi:hypothetical protein
MPMTKVIRYRVNPYDADENDRLVRAVYDELADQRPEGMRYLTVRLDDGATFVHIAVFDGDDNPLARSPAFAEFQSGIHARCVEGPIAADANIVGSFGLSMD